MKSFVSLASILSAVAVLAAAPNAFAIQNGTLGPTSSATITVSGRLEAPPPSLVRITGLDNVTFGGLVADGGVVSDFMCIYHTSPTVRLTITQVGGGNLRMVGPSSAVVDLGVAVGNTTAPAAGAFRGGEQVVLTGLVGNTVSETCAAGPSNPSEVLWIRYAAPLPGLPVGTYTGTLNLLLAPE